MIENLEPDSDLVQRFSKDLERYRGSLFWNLQEKYDESDLEDFSQLYDENLNKFIEREKLFYNKVVSTLRAYVWEEQDTSFYLFFDIDETIATRCQDSCGKVKGDIIRPSLKILLQDLQHIYPNIRFAICSSRGQEHIEKFIEEHSEYPFEFGVSSRGFSCDPLDDESRWRNCRMWHYNKARAMVDISEKYSPSRCILVDDIIESPFEEKKLWISVWSSQFYGSFF